MIPLIIFYIFIFSILFGIFLCIIEPNPSLLNGEDVIACFVSAILWPMSILAMIAYCITSKFFNR